MTLDQLRSFCLAMPCVTEEIKWGHDLCFMVGSKMFCVASLEAPLTFSVKVTDENFTVLTEQAGMVPAPYLARYKWVLVQEPDRFLVPQLEQLMADSYYLISAKLTKKAKLAAGLV
ncbi:MmcQ/YjbR family DNA-binding protein [Rufibacter sp. LB8]|uniref:MmcQ/YjbR family DNA-binding protein n=1 Tax=Rufibacter sp. LB8 TaxID=2777781 RepID=UPI00178C64F4|nr:MmcQ/YjbR family DNA-binding protein [Rufibacter sp. LB8]